MIKNLLKLSTGVSILCILTQNAYTSNSQDIEDNIAYKNNYREGPQLREKRKTTANNNLKNDELESNAQKSKGSDSDLEDSSDSDYKEKKLKSNSNDSEDDSKKNKSNKKRKLIFSKNDNSKTILNLENNNDLEEIIWIGTKRNKPQNKGLIDKINLVQNAILQEYDYNSNEFNKTSKAMTLFIKDKFLDKEMSESTFWKIYTLVFQYGTKKNLEILSKIQSSKSKRLGRDYYKDFIEKESSINASKDQPISQSRLSDIQRQPTLQNSNQQIPKNNLPGQIVSTPIPNRVQNQSITQSRFLQNGLGQPIPQDVGMMPQQVIQQPSPNFIPGQQANRVFIANAPRQVLHNGREQQIPQGMGVMPQPNQLQQSLNQNNLLNNIVFKNLISKMTVDQLFTLKGKINNDLNPLEDLTCYEEGGVFHKDINALRTNFGISNGKIVPENYLRAAAKIAKDFGEPLLSEGTRIYVKINDQQQTMPINIENIYSSLENWNKHSQKMNTYISMLENLEKNRHLINNYQYQTAIFNIRDFQRLLFDQSKIFEITQHMINEDRFSPYYFNDKKSAIHIENGYVTKNNVYTGVVKNTGEPEFDGVQIEKRLDTYHTTMSECFNLVLDLGSTATKSFYEAFNNSQCLDARIYPLQSLIAELRNKKDVLTNDSKSMPKDQILEFEFSNLYLNNLTKEEMLDQISLRRKDKESSEGIISLEDIERFIEGKYLYL